jgi:hypothetical protein
MWHYSNWLILNPPILIFQGIGTPTPPVEEYFLLSDDTNFLLSDGTNLDLS